MRIVETYSHLNGLEYLMVHKKKLWKEIRDVVASVNAKNLRTKISKEKNMVGKSLYLPPAMNAAFDLEFKKCGWKEQRTSYWVTSDARLIRKTLTLTEKEQKTQIVAAGKKPIFSYNQTDFVRDRIAVEVQFGKYAFDVLKFIFLLFLMLIITPQGDVASLLTVSLRRHYPDQVHTHKRLAFICNGYNLSFK